MKKAIILLFVFMTSLSSFAQKTPLAKYDVLPAAYDDLYYQYVKNFVVRKLPSSVGYYFGQISDDNQLEGYATYEGLEGGTIIGQYYQGTLLFGITMTKEFINVGTKDFYASYSATTCELLGVYNDGVFRKATPQEVKSYLYAQLTYPNGDRYVGEIFNGKRHGYGVYYFKNGGFWYGPFHDNKQVGYGALFTAEGKMRIGKWGE